MKEGVKLELERHDFAWCDIRVRCPENFRDGALEGREMIEVISKSKT
jgi:hypothetical protein